MPRRRASGRQALVALLCLFLPLLLATAGAMPPAGPSCIEASFERSGRAPDEDNGMPARRECADIVAKSRRPTPSVLQARLEHASPYHVVLNSLLPGGHAPARSPDRAVGGRNASRIPQTATPNRPLPPSQAPPPIA